MTERAAYLVDRVWPEVPVRQWVFTLPPRMRYVLAWRHDLCTAVAGVLFRAVQRHLRSWAQTRGLGEVRSGAVIIVQRFPPHCAESAQWGPRFGGALNLNVHLHALVLDGVFARACDGRLRFHRAPAPTAADVADVLAAIVPGVRARLARRGLDEDGDEGADRFVDAAPGLAGLATASVQGVLALGGVPGRRPHRLGDGGGLAAALASPLPHRHIIQPLDDHTRHPHRRLRRDRGDRRRRHGPGVPGPRYEAGSRRRHQDSARGFRRRQRSRGPLPA